MASMEFDKYGGKEGFGEFKTGAGAKFIERNGQDIDPFGDFEKKEKDAIDMNAGEAFNHKDLTKIEAMGTDYAKKKYNQVEQRQDGYHFKTDEDNHNIDPYGTDCGKKQSFQTVRRK